MMRGGDTRPKEFSWPADLTAPLAAVPAASRYWVALSGGLDSVLLLHVASTLPQLRQGGLTALHVNHQLQPNAATCETFCRDLCADLGVPLRVERVTVTRDRGGLEEAARQARYQAFARGLEAGNVLLMAHHADDQAETVFFRLLRGSGVLGLGGIPAARSLAQGRVFRPWLGLTRERLREVARAAGMTWVEDPSNIDERHDRNFLRHTILPLLKTRWPYLERRLASTAQACREADALAQSLALIHYQQTDDGEGNLMLAGLARLAPVERKNLLGWWIRSHDYPVPGLADWDQVIDELLCAADDGAPELRGAGFAVRRFRGALYLVADPLPVPAGEERLVPGAGLAWGGWRLRLEPAVENPPAAPDIRVSVRSGGERIRTSPDGVARPLKKWLQEQQVPPWEREILPLFLKGKELVGAGHLWTSPAFSGAAPESGWRIVQERDCD
ncbi:MULTISPECIES: tRNA lysidine(34) synthetase TilS [Marinobacter]|uniref:tRNA(Ile)-lysidine synthase n=1 Tax=Marinobacter profundi TaxID=2666256 RepID=A0A2G1UQ38_9GAMM|nr:MULTISPECIES: tRNA lysidine(34) synthetase TilS [Marinobacter]MBD3656030.1 tRNA lysidine(34) synthetase TilS [Marinobacter sp.]PHQ16614.1 tRNA lysidine(34) synthetase TilS [Marinobacter profundi]